MKIKKRYIPGNRVSIHFLHMSKMILGKSVVLVICLGASFLVLSLNTKIREAADTRTLSSQAQATELYSNAHLQCRKRWPLVDPLEVHECAAGILE